MSFVKCGTLQLSYQYKNHTKAFPQSIVGKYVFETIVKYPTAYSPWNNGVTNPAHGTKGKGSKDIVTHADVLQV